MSPIHRIVFISSTAIDLPEHRRKVIEACNQLGHRPDGMEHWPATDAGALELCLAKVDKADVFVGVYERRGIPTKYCEWGVDTVDPSVIIPAGRYSCRIQMKGKTGTQRLLSILGTTGETLAVAQVHVVAD